MVVAKSDDKSFLYFEDIVEKYDDPAGWITVARSDDSDKRDSRSLFSALAPDNQSVREQLFRGTDWDVHPDNFGHPCFDGRGEVEFSLGNKASSNDVVIESFMVYRNFHGPFPNAFEPVQNFILYHNLVRDDASGQYIEPISTDPVIRYFGSENVQIRLRHLKDYLAARKMLLVRFHDHHRRIARPVAEIIGKDHDSLKINSDSRLYTVNVYTFEEEGSRLCGKDIIKPYDEPRHRDYLFLSRKDKKYEDFIWKLDPDGNRIEASCAPNKASDNLVRWIYFRKTVLQKYYASPRSCQVSDGQLKHLDLWSISYGQNECNLVTVLLGDLGNLPHEEQLHWKQYNVDPEGGIGRAFFERQFMAKFTESDDPVHRIVHLRGQINKKFQETFGFLLFRQLAEDDRHVLDTLHSLTSNEQKEFDEQILYLAKCFVDSLDTKSLKSRTNWTPEVYDAGHNNTLKYFDHFLRENTGLQPSDVSGLVKIFKMIQNLRSLSTAHTKSSGYKEYLKKTNLDKFGPQERFLSVVYDFSVELKKLLSVTASDTR